MSLGKLKAECDSLRRKIWDFESEGKRFYCFSWTRPTLVRLSPTPIWEELSYSKSFWGRNLPVSIVQCTGPTTTIFDAEGLLVAKRKSGNSVKLRLSFMASGVPDVAEMIWLLSNWHLTISILYSKAVRLKLAISNFYVSPAIVRKARRKTRKQIGDFGKPLMLSSF